MHATKIEKEQGHWLLAKMGKKVLRPGGRELTEKLIRELQVCSQDDVVEFAPGLGFTAAIAIGQNPKTYTGIELDEEAAQLLRKKITGGTRQIIIGNASAAPLPDGCASKVYGEAMLSMHVDHRKTDIIKEAYRLLRPGGLYGIHELGLMPDNISNDVKSEIQRELAVSLKVNARPLTQAEWIALVEQQGFKVRQVFSNPMHLLKTGRMIEDEGLFRFFKIGFNIATHPKAAKRILNMRSVFMKYEKLMNAVALVAEKVP